METDKIILLVIGILFLAAGVCLLAKQLRKRKNNTVSATAEVVGYTWEVHHDADGMDGYVYYPVLKYCVSGRWYEGKGDVGSNRKKYSTGERVGILYDPDEPENFSISGDRTGLFMAAAAMVIGIGIILLAFFSG